MTVTTITSEGSVPLPDAVRDAMGLKPGSEVTVEYCDGSAVIRPRTEMATGTRRHDSEDFSRRLDSVRGTANFDGMTTDEYLDVIRDRKA
jgi:AbrB family looped-hinge helix DNA binding protein